jgi:hypothetical protein
VNADKLKLEMKFKIEGRPDSPGLDSECNILQEKVTELRKKIDTAKKEQEESKAVRTQLRRNERKNTRLTSLS